MRIGLCPQLSLEGNTEENLSRIETCAKEAQRQGLSLIVFGEAYLQGFDSLHFDPQKDQDIAVTIHSPLIDQVKALAQAHEVAIGFGFHERTDDEQPRFYAAYMVVGSQGETLCHYRRMSSGWRYPDSPACYREGTAPCTFTLNGLTLGVMMCGDFWEDLLMPTWQQLDSQVDAWLWPVHCDYPLADWLSGTRDEYRAHTKHLEKPVLFVNNLHADTDRARGCAAHWHQGLVVAEYPAGEPGMLTTSIP